MSASGPSGPLVFNIYIVDVSWINRPFYIKFNTVESGLSIVYIEVSQLIYFQIKLYAILFKIVFILTV